SYQDHRDVLPAPSARRQARLSAPFAAAVAAVDGKPDASGAGRIGGVDERTRSGGVAPDSALAGDMIRPRIGMVLAAGRGERLRPITDSLPKPLVRIAGRALIDHAI